jgi:PAS domain S-box-containing protein
VTKSDKDEIGIIEARGAQGDIATVDSVGADVVGIFESIDIPILVVGRDCHLARFNRAAAEVLGVAPSDIGRRTCNMQALADFPEIDQTCIQVMVDGVPSRHDMRNGDRWFVVRISPYAGTDRQVGGAVLAFTNITAFRASLGQAIYEREYAKTIVNTVIDPLVVLGDRLQVQAGNRAFYDWFGASREQTQGVPLSDLGDNDWKASGFWSSLQATLLHNREFQTIEFEGTFPNIGRRTVLLDARRLVRDGTALALLAFRDITERKQAEQAWRESETRFRTLFDSMDEGYCVIEMIFDEKNNPVDYRFLEVNPAFERQTGIKNARGRLMRQIAPDHEQHWFDIYGRIALTGATLRFENQAAALRRYYDVCAFRVEAPELRRVGVLFNDITERKNLDRQRELLLERARLELAHIGRVSLVGQLTASLAHELLQPITVVVSNAETGLHDPDLAASSEVRALLQDIADSGLRAAEIIHNVRGLLRKERGPHMKVDLNRLVEEVVNVMRSDLLRHQVRLITHLDSANAEIDGDRVELQQVLLNLMLNGTEAMSAIPASERQLVVATIVRATAVEFNVRDSGIGSAPEDLKRLFEPFFTTKPHGVGMGLSICAQIVSAHKGQLSAENNADRGMTWRCLLPRAG